MPCRLPHALLTPINGRLVPTNKMWRKPYLPPAGSVKKVAVAAFFVESARTRRPIPAFTASLHHTSCSKQTMGAGISSGRLLDRRDAEHVFKNIGYVLSTAVKCKDENGKDCIVDVEAVSSYKVNARIAVAFESVIDDMVRDATTCFPHRSPRTGVPRITSIQVQAH